MAVKQARVSVLEVQDVILRDGQLGHWTDVSSGHRSTPNVANGMHTSVVVMKTVNTHRKRSKQPNFMLSTQDGARATQTSAEAVRAR